MKIEIQNAGGSVAVAPSAPAAPSTPQPATPVTSGMSTSAAVTVVLEVLANKTGYETDMLEMDMDLETELGVDSIKRVEILSDVQSQLGIEAQDVAALGRTRTVGEVVEAMKLEILSAGGSVEKLVSTPALTPGGTSVNTDSAVSVVLEVLANKTGYETDMLEMDMDLETELGVDSIKRVEILSDVQAQLGIEAQDVAALGRTRTVGEVVDAMKLEIANAGGLKTPFATPAPSVLSRGNETSFLSDSSSVDLTFAHLKVLPDPDSLQLESPVNRPVIVVDDNTDLTMEIVKIYGRRAVVLSIKGGQFSKQRRLNQTILKDMSEGALMEALATVESKYGVPGGVIYQHRQDADDMAQFGWLMLLAKHTSKALNQTIEGGRCFFLTVARMNGCLGLGKHAGSLHTSLQGALFGLAKTLDHEWNHVFCRGIDLAIGMTASSAAQCVVQESTCPNTLVREVGYDTQGVRRTTQASKLSLPSRDQVLDADMRVSSTDAFIVTGGGRGITPLCIAELAKSIRGGTFFLLGRTALMQEPTFARGKSGKDLDKAVIGDLKRAQKAGGPKCTPKKHKAMVNAIAGSREVNDSIRLIENNGGRAIYLPCDVGNSTKVQEVLRKASSDYNVKITGIIHAAGVLRDKKIEDKKLDEFNFVYGVKVKGLMNILDSMSLGSLKHLVMFSSLAGFHGNVGQVDYAMANDALNKIGHYVASAHPQCRVKAMDFGPWDYGMVTPQLKAHFRAGGVQIIPPGEGAEIVAAMITSSAENQCLVGNWLSPPVACIRDRDQILRKVNPEKNLFLQSHRIQGKRVLPMTVACGNLATIALQLNPGYFIDSVRDLKLFVGVQMEETVDLMFDVLKDDASTREKIILKVKLSAVRKGRQSPAYGGTVILVTKPKSQANTPRLFDLSENPGANISLYNSETLFHGPHFQGIKKVLTCDNDHITTECQKVDVSDIDQGQFPANCGYIDHFAADIALQSFLVWVRSKRNAAALPNACEFVEYLAPFPQKGNYYTTLVRDGGKMKDSIWTAMMYMHDADGKLYLQGRCSVVVSPGLNY